MHLIFKTRKAAREFAAKQKHFTLVDKGAALPKRWFVNVSR